MKKWEVVVTTDPHRNSLVAEMWNVDELLGEIVIEQGKLLLLIGARQNGSFHKIELSDFETLLAKAKSEALINSKAENFANSAAGLHEQK